MAICKVFTEGVLAALSGGYYHDRTQTDFINLTHLYLWLLLFSLPLCASLFTSSPWLCMSLYALCVTLVVTLLKVITLRLHHLYDTTEPLRRVEFGEDSGNEPHDSSSERPLRSLLMPRPRHHRGISHEEDGIEGSGRHDIFLQAGPSPDSTEDNTSRDATGLQGSSTGRLSRYRCDSPVPWLHVPNGRQRTAENGQELSGTTTSGAAQVASPENHSGQKEFVRTQSEVATVGMDLEKGDDPVLTTSISMRSRNTTSRMPNTTEGSSSHAPTRHVPLQQLSKAECRQRLEALRSDVGRLRLPTVPADFEPSIADLALLDPNPTHRNYVTSISRSRNNSQRRRSFRTPGAHPRPHTLTATVLQTVTTTTTTTTVRRHSSANSGVLPQQMRTRLHQLRQLREANGGTLPGSGATGSGCRGRPCLPMRTQSLRQTSSTATTTNTGSGRSTAVTLSRQSTFTGGVSAVRGQPFTNLLRSRPQSLRHDERPVWPQESNRNAAELSSGSLRSHSALQMHLQQQQPTRLTSTASEKTLTEKMQGPLNKLEDQGGTATPSPPPLPPKTSAKEELLEREHVDFVIGIPENDDIADSGNRTKRVSVDETSTSSAATRSQTFQRRRRGAIRRASKPQSSMDASGNPQGPYPVEEEDVLMDTHSSHRRRRDLKLLEHPLSGGPSSSSGGALLAPVSLPPPFEAGLSTAAPHEDTTVGSEHWFQDPSGEWMVYTFGGDCGEALTAEEWYMRRRARTSDATAASSSSSAVLQLPVHPMHRNSNGARRLPAPVDTNPSPDQRFSVSQTGDSPQFSLEELYRAQISASSPSAVTVEENGVFNELAQGAGAAVSGGRVATPALERSGNPPWARGGSPLNLPDESNASPVLDHSGPWENWRPFLSEAEAARGSDKPQRKKKAVYRLPLLPFSKKLFTLKFGRLDLDTLLDRNHNLRGVLCCIALSGLICVLATLLLVQQHFHNLSLLIFCAVVASAHYCLVKSVQPDTASPQQGYNAMIVYSRGAYFCLFASGLLLCDALLLAFSPTATTPPSHSAANYGGLTLPLSRMTTTNESAVSVAIFGITIRPLVIIAVTHRVFYYLLLYFPLLFLFGLLPQVNTFLTYAMEQVDIHVFGASGAAGLLEVLFSLARSLCELLGVYGLCYGGLVNSSAPNAPPHVLLSIFWGVHLALVYLLSRMPSNLISYFRAMITYQRTQKRQAAELAANHVMPSDANPIVANPEEVTHAAGGGENAVLKSGEEQDTESCVTSGGSLRTKRFASWHEKDYLRVSTTVETAADDHVDSGGVEETSPSSSGPRISRKASKTATPMKSNMPTAVICSEEGDVLSREGDEVSRLSIIFPKRLGCENKGTLEEEEESHQPRHRYTCDPQPLLMSRSLCSRLRGDLLSGFAWCVLGFSLHVSTAFSSPSLQPALHQVVLWLVISVGFLLHYVWPHLQKPCPWQLLNAPIIKSSLTGHVTTWEVALCHLLWLERNVCMPLLVLSSLSLAVNPMLAKFGPYVTAGLLPLCSGKMLRHGFSHSSQFYLSLLFTQLMFTCDYAWADEGLLMNYMLGSFLVAKIRELIMKLQFVFVYIAPWKMIWGSVFHGFAQLAYVPHSMFLVLQCCISTCFSAPLEPFLASAIFISSYVRPIKFWEANYTTQYADNSNTALSSQMRHAFEPSGESTNAIFYEHLTRSVQRSLAGDLLLGRWGTVTHGDIYILAYEEFHFLVHIIEIGNGFVTFQLRGLELMGTFCHEHETEELRRNPATDSGCCCCQAFCWLPHMLSFNAAMAMRWSAWELIFPAYYLDAYSISDHSAITSLQIIDFRKLIVLYFVRAMVYYACKLRDLREILHKLREALAPYTVVEYADYDHVFGDTLNEDFDVEVNGISRRSFLHTHSKWIDTCLAHRYRQSATETPLTADEKILLQSLCFALSLFGRRSVFAGYRIARNSSVDSFLSGFYNIFHGHMSVNPPDEWVLCEVSLVPRVVQSGIHMAVKLYQDQFVCANLAEEEELLACIRETERHWVICHEADPLWRHAILNDAPNLCSFRLTSKSTQYFQVSYRIVMYSRNRLQFRVVKINSECVRGLWASQQQEQIFLRNRNPERGSIQHAKQVLRNLINSSCDQPIGYPIYVSPLTTSFAEDSGALREAASRGHSSLLLLGVKVSSVGQAISRIRAWLHNLRNFCHAMRNRSGAAEGHHRSRAARHTTQEAMEMTSFTRGSTEQGAASRHRQSSSSQPLSPGVPSTSFSGALSLGSGLSKQEGHPARYLNAAQIHLDPSSAGATTGGSLSSRDVSARTSLHITGLSGSTAGTDGAPSPLPLLPPDDLANQEVDGKLASYVSAAVSLGGGSGTLLPAFVIKNVGDVLLDKHSKLSWPHAQWCYLTTLSLSLLPSRPASTSSGLGLGSVSTGPSTTTTATMASLGTSSSTTGPPSSRPQTGVNTNILQGLRGLEMHRWSPSHPELHRRSFCHRVIVLLRIPSAATSATAETPVPGEGEKRASPFKMDTFWLVYESGLQPAEYNPPTCEEISLETATLK